MSGQRIWDVSQRIHPGMPMWPGEPKLRVAQHATISDECPVNVGSIAMPLHTGTHADAPFHYANEGEDSAASAIDAYVGPCVVIDARGASSRVEMDDCDWKAIKGHTRVLLRTYSSFPHDRWVASFKAIAPDVVCRLAQMQVRLIGVDAPSLDPQTSKTMDAHHQVLAADMRILEGLVLDDVPAGEYELIALPLKIAGADASPVRAILRELA